VAEIVHPAVRPPRRGEKGLLCMIRVKARGSESVEQMVRRFKKLCEKEGLTRDIKRTSYYEKPSERRRRKTRKSLKRIQKDLLLL
jgi:small subunit ribosomal protein S21